MVTIEGTGRGRRMIQKYKDLDVETKAVVISPEELLRDTCSSGTPATVQPKTATPTRKADGQRQQPL